MRILRGFTLVEVLITLGVIGVIAAITIPTVVKKYQERVTVSKVKKFYSTINQAFLLSVKDNGYANDWNVTNGKNNTTAYQIANYFKPYLKIIKDCGTNSGCLNYESETKFLSGSSNINYNTNSTYYKIILNDGSYVFIRGSNNYCKDSDGGVNNSCGVIFTDTNGKNQPNIVGKDIFAFEITPFSIQPVITNDCSKNNTGWGCSGYILKYGNMDYLR